MPTVLVIDDEPAIRFSIARVFDGEGIDVLTAESAEEGLHKFREESPDAVLLDIRLGEDDGLRVFDDLRAIDPKCLVVFITGHGTSETAIEAMKRGAYDYLVKPLDAATVIEVVRKACSIRRLVRTPAIVKGGGDRDVDGPDLILGGGSAMRSVFKQIGRVAGQDVNVLVLGESGTGKELVARALYHHSRRSSGPFVAINCAALSETLLESELFGHEKGAFTGADRRRLGKFEQAHGGTMFLDEVGDMAPGTQAKILRLLQDGRFERVGGNESLSCDVRLIAATNRDLDTMISAGTFRLDLFYRLRGVTISLPPLRDRVGDIPELAHYFLFRYNRLLETDVHSIAEETLDIFRRYRWPGNVRELQSVVRESLLRSAGPVLLPEFVPESVRHEADERGGGGAGGVEPPFELPDVPNGSGTWDSLARRVVEELGRGEAGVYRRALADFDALLVRQAMEKTGGNQAAAAELLGLSRPTLRAKIRSVLPHRLETVARAEAVARAEVGD